MSELADMIAANAAAEENQEEIVVTDQEAEVEDTTGMEEGIEGQSSSSESTEEEGIVDTKPLWEEYGFKSQKEFKEHYASLSEVEKAYGVDKDNWTAKEKELSDKLARELDNQKLYVTDESLARLNILKNKEDKTEYKLYSKLVLNEGGDAKSVIAMKMAQDYPDMSAKDINDYIEDTYNLTQEEPDEFSSEAEKARWNRTLRMNQMKMEKDSKNILKEYMDEFNSIELPYKKPASEADIAVSRAEARKEWAEYSKDITAQAGKFKFNLKVGDTNLPLEYSLSEKQIGKYEQLLLDTVHRESIRGSNKEAANDAFSRLKTTILNDNFNDILNSAVESVSKHFNDYWKNELTSPSSRGVREIKQGSAIKDNGLSAVRELLNK